nr:syndapin-like protein 3 [Parasacculina yatsui]
MSNHSDEQAAVSAGSDSFWEPGNYKRTTRRIEDGSRLCDDLSKMIAERAELEKTYAKGLRMWSKKWNEHIEKGPEYGTSEAACRAILGEADRLSDLHSQVRNRLMSEVCAKVKGWQKDNFHKTMMHLKERKDMDELFKKAQKSWAKQFDKVNKAKADYHSACKQEMTAKNQEKFAGADSASEAGRKLAERVQKCSEETSRMRERYTGALQELSDMNPRYVEDMTDVFNKCQQREAERMLHLKQTLRCLHQCLDISSNAELPQIYGDMLAALELADHDKDLLWWSNTHGVNMSMNWPAFEEYSEELHEIGGSMSRVRRLLSHDPEASGVTLVKKTVSQDHNGSLKRGDTTEAGSKRGPVAGASGSGNSGPVSNGPADAAADGGEDWDDYSTELVDNGEPGVPVEALYDYDGVEDDELSFKKGDRFDKLEDEDEQGWCKGRMNGQVGLYPANYVKEV